MKASNPSHSSRTSLPHEQNGDSYGQYGGQPRGYVDDYPGTSRPQNGSPRGAGTPTRFNNYYDDYGGDNYRASPVAYDSNPRFGVEQDSFESPTQQKQPFYGSANHIEPFRGGHPGPVEDSFYRQSPMLEPRYDSGGRDPRDNYMDHPGDGYPGDNGYREEDSFQQPPVDRYGQPLEDSFQGSPQHPGYRDDEGDYPNIQPGYRDDEGDYPNSQPGYRDDQGDYPENQPGYPDDSYRGHPDDSFRGPPPHDGRGPEYIDDGYNGQGYPGDNYRDDSYGPESDRRHEGLPQVQDDPFADDPFRQKQRSLLQLQREDEPYPRGPSPGSDRMGGPGSYTDRPPGYNHLDSADAPRPYYDDDIVPGEGPIMRGPPPEEYPEGRNTPSIQGGTMRWRSPDLQEVIDYLSHPSDAIKANAAAYLTHLSYMDDGIKQKIRGLDGIPLLVDLLNSEYPEVHKNACGALKNLSYGRHNEINKQAVKNAGGIPALVRLLRKSQDEDVKDAVTGVLWNLSSSDSLKRPIIDDGLAVLVNSIIIPHSGWEQRGVSAHHVPWTTVFRNATGVLRNVSSDGIEARKKLRECHGLVESLVYTLRIAIDQSNVDNKPLENCVCTLRNLSFRIQEIEDPDFFKKRSATLQRQRKADKGEKTGCFGGSSSKKKTTPKGKSGHGPEVSAPNLPPSANEYKALWGVDVIRYYHHLLKCSLNPVTLEAACGALQNLAACDWKPAVEIRSLVRKEKALPSLVDLLTYEVERVVCASATALRNLSIDEQNQDLVGKYAMKQLISNLPQENRQKEKTDETICAVLACLNEVLVHNQDFVKAFCLDGGLQRLMHIVRNQNNFNARTYKFAAAVLKTMWKFKVLHGDYQTMGYTEKDFNPPLPTGSSQPNSNFSTPYNTINRPIDGQGYDDTTMASRRGNGYHGSNQRIEGHVNPGMDQQDRYGSRQGRMNEISMTDLGPGYAPIDEQRNHRNKPPAGGVALFPNMQPGSQQHLASPGTPNQEPLYARVNKKRRDEMDEGAAHGNVLLGQDQGQEGADSWV